MARLLVVEDSAEMRRLLRLLVRDLTDAFYECSDGTEAVAAYATHRPDWVLMDVEMKLRDGLTATRELRAAYPDAKVIIVTQYNDRYYRDAAQKAGACAYVLKDNLLELRYILGAANSVCERRSPPLCERNPSK